MLMFARASSKAEDADGVIGRRPTALMLAKISFIKEMSRRERSWRRSKNYELVKEREASP